MKVLQVNSVCGRGSTGKIAVDLAKVLEQNGDECLIAYGRSTAPQGVNSVRISEDTWIKWHGALSRITDRQGFYSKKASRKLIKVIREYQPDLIQLHNLHGYYLHIPSLFQFLAEAQIPVVWTLHDCWPFTGHCAYFDYANCDKWKTLCKHCPQKKRYPKSLLWDSSAKNYRQKKERFGSVSNMTIVTPSQWLAGLVKQSFLEGYPVEVIPNGIDLTVFQHTESEFRSRYGLENKAIVLGVANSWDYRKGLDAFRQLAACLDDSFRIVLVGINRKQMAGLPDNIIAIEKTQNQQELAQIYTAADVFVNPTLEDNFPTTNLEALACGTPVITYQTGGSGESITPQCGAVVEKGNIDALIKAIHETCCISRDVCLDRANLYEKGKRFQEYIQLYQKILKEKE